MEVRVIRSGRRKKTAQARLVEGVLEVRIPAHLSAAREAEFVEHFTKRMARYQTANDEDLAKRAAQLAKKFGLPKPTSIRWVSNQQHRWGSCSPDTGVIRLSNRMTNYPSWVVDHVIVHELAHLREPGHGPAFQALVRQNPLAERAEGFLLAKMGGDDPSVDPLADDEPESDGRLFGE